MTGRFCPSILDGAQFAARMEVGLEGPKINDKHDRVNRDIADNNIAYRRAFRARNVLPRLDLIAQPIQIRGTVNRFPPRTDEISSGISVGCVPDFHLCDRRLKSEQIWIVRFCPKDVLYFSVKMKAFARRRRLTSELDGWRSIHPNNFRHYFCRFTSTWHFISGCCADILYIFGDDCI